MHGFSPLTTEWFAHRFGSPTDVQRLGWPSIQARQDTLIAAPTGSGKTLAAFLVSIDQLLHSSLSGTTTTGVHTVYVSPLKALSNDIERNLASPISEVLQLARRKGLSPPDIRVGLRTGDTTASQRQAMARNPPHILVTTPESLYMLLTSEKSREMLRGVQSIIIDEIHALARDKRGSHLSLSLERLETICAEPPVRIGLSATQKPIEEIAGFLVGAGRLDETGRPRCVIVDAGHLRQLDLDVEVPQTPLGAVATREHWDQVHGRLVELIDSHRATLVFVNTRRMAERVSFQLSNRLGKEHVSSHHGSLSKEIRLEAERKLKTGELKAIVATASLELGIDVGYVDLVCQIGSPRSIATTLQRIGRSGHWLGAIPKGRLFALTRDDLVECLALARSIRRAALDAVEMPCAPLDILAQQIVAAVSTEEWNEDQLFSVVRRAWSYRNVNRASFDALLRMLSQEGAASSRAARIHRDRINGTIRASKGARIIATTCGGAIPDNADFPVLSSDGSLVGTVNEDFAIESMPGDIFLLGNTSWRILQVRAGEVIVEDAHGAPPSIPFWLGEAPGRSAELSHEVSELRREVAERIPPSEPSHVAQATRWLADETQVGEGVIEQAVAYIACQKAAIGLVPTQSQVVFERFFDETGGMQLVIHAPFGSRINRGWGLAFRKRFCRSFNFELQASADDNGIVLSLGPQHSFPIEDLFSMLNGRNARHILEQAVLDSPIFKIRWRWNSTRSLLVLRQRGGKRVPPALQRFRADDVLTAIFPDSTACLENRPADVAIPDHPIVVQTMYDCLHEAADFDRWMSILEQIEQGRIQLIARDTTEPSPFAQERLHAMPYAFLDDAPLEERRARAVSSRRSVTIDTIGDLSRLDREAIDTVKNQAWPVARTCDEFQEVLFQLHVLREEELSSSPDPSSSDGKSYLDELIASGRAAWAKTSGGERFAIAAERWPIIRAAYPSIQCEPELRLPAHLDSDMDATDARTAVVRGRMEVAGPLTAARLASIVGMSVEQVVAALARLEAEGAVLRGRFDPEMDAEQWCDRRLLARIHRRTLEDARRRVQAVSTADYMRYLLGRHGILNSADRSGPGDLFETIATLAGMESPVAAWEHDIFPARLADYDPAWLDELMFTGAVGWGRLVPPTSSAEKKRSTGINRVAPISIFPREELPWLLPPNRASAEDQARAEAKDVWLILRERGALFPSDLLAACELLPAQLDNALGELAALGLVSADGFAGIRSLVAPSHPNRKRSNGVAARRRHPRWAQRSISGRWSLFPPNSFATPADRVEKWAQLLLARYGVVFRDLLERESVAPPWWELVRVYRRLEARGEIHGGRFVAGVAYEQFAQPGAVDDLRRLRDKPSTDRPVVLSAADPLNLTGILDPGPRVPATRGNAIAIDGGRVVAHWVAGNATFLGLHSPSDREWIERLFQLAGPSRWRRAHESTKREMTGLAEAGA